MSWEQEFLKDLTEEQKNLLDQFRNNVKNNLKCNLDDYNLWRWLKARKYNLEKAEKKLKENLKFRRNIGLDTILTDYEDPELVKKYLPEYFVGFDEDGDAIVCYQTGASDLKGFTLSLSDLDQVKSYVYHLEVILQKMREESEKRKKRCCKISYLEDMKGIHLSQVLDMKFVKRTIDISLIFEMHYPEVLKRVYIINAPSYFSLWFNFAKALMDPDVLSKVEVYTDGTERIREVFDPDIIPAVFGGNLTDPDGNPKCYTMFPRNLKIPTSCYFTDPLDFKALAKDPKAKKILVRERGFYNHPIHVKQKNTVIRWCFETMDNDIGFSVNFIGGTQMSTTSPADTGSIFGRWTKMERQEKRESDAPEVIVPLERIRTNLYPEKDELLCENVGKYVLHFDNTHSWTRAKELFLKVEVIAPNKRSETEE